MTSGPTPAPSLGLRERHKKNRRTAILRAVRELLREEGDREPTRERIAERAEVASATVFNLIGSRADLWAALADEFQDELEARLGAEEHGDAVTWLRRIVDVTVDQVLEDPKVSKRMLRGWEESGLLFKRAPMAQILAALEEARAEGFIARDADVKVVAASISTACLGAVHLWAAGIGAGAKFRERARLAVDVALAAAATPEHHARLRASLRRRATRGSA